MSALVIQTPLELVTEALVLSGAVADGQTPSANQVSRAFRFLNGIIASWISDRYLSWCEQDINFVSNGNDSFTIGIGGNFNTARPDKIMGAYARYLPVTNNQPLDRPLRVIAAHEDYALICLKNLAAYPTVLFYDSQYPVGNIYVNPVPPANQFEIHILVKNQIAPFVSQTQQLGIPANYIEALKWNLAAYLIVGMQLPDDPGVVALAESNLQAIRLANIQTPMSKYPRGYPRGGRSSDPWWAGMYNGNQGF